MRKKFTLAVLMGLLAAMLGFVSPTPAGAQSCTQDITGALYGPTHIYRVRTTHCDFGTWGRFHIEAFRYSYQWVYLGLEIDTWFRDSTCPSFEADQYTPMIAFRGNSESDRGLWCTGYWRSPEFVNEVDVPPNQNQTYGYYCWPSSCVLQTVNGAHAYGGYAPIDRTSYADVHQRLY